MRGGASVFDTFTKDDIVLAFFPCIYFCGLSQVMFSWTAKNLAALPYKERMDAILARNEKRAQYYALLNKLCGVALMRGFRLIVENPYSMQTHLRVFLKQPDIVDNNRMERGDYMMKPTAYWFFNCEPEHGFTHQNDKKRVAPMSLRSSAVAGVCSEERSMISPDYARNFIHDFLLGRSQPDIDLQLF